MKKGLLTLTLLTASVLVSAQNLNLTIREAVRIAIDNNVTLKQQQNQLRVNQAQKLQSYAQIGPTLTGSITAWRSDGNTFLQQEARVVNTVSENASGQLNANIILFNGFNRINSIQQAKYLFDSQKRFVERTEQDIINLTAVQFLQTLVDQELLVIANQNLGYQNTLAEQIRESVELGSLALVDQYTADAEIKRLELEVLRAEFNLRNDKAILAQTLALDPAVDFSLEAPDWDVNEESLSSYSLDSLYNAALQNRPDLKQAQENRTAARRGIAIARSAFMPSLGAFASLSSRYSDATANRNFDEQFFTDNKFQQFGAQLSIPIFNGLQNRTRYVQAKVSFENSELTMAGLEQTIKTEVLNAYRNFQDVTNAYEVSEAQLAAQKLAFDTQSESYSLGVADQVALQLATQSYTQAQTSFAQSRHRLLFQKLMLDYAIGTLQFSDIPE